METSTWQRMLLAAVAGLCGGTVWANGGPVAWTHATAMGDVSPREEGRVALAAEDLRIRLLDDGVHYEVAARYTLRNVGPPISVPYGVPVFWYGSDIGEVDAPTEDIQKSASDKEHAYAASIRIAVGERTFPCALQGVKRVEREGLVPYLYGWCVTTLDIPTGEAVALTLSYTGSYRFMDMQYTKSPFTVYGDRELDYDLVPASYWKGPTQALSVEIDTGRWSDFYLADHPTGWTTEGTKRIWRATDVDLKFVGRVTGTLAASQVLESEERTAYRPDLKVTAVVSGELPKDGDVDYRAANVLDGKASTAWCAHHGTMVWVELHLDAVQAQTCPLQGFVVVPGYAKSQATWIGNRRLKSIGLGPCDTFKGATEVHLNPSSRVDTSAVEVPAPKGLDTLHDGYCIRLIPWEAEGGRKADVCVSEFKPVLNCG